MLEPGSLSEDVFGVNVMDTVSAFPAVDILLWSNSSLSSSRAPELSLLPIEAEMPCRTVLACCLFLGVIERAGLGFLVACSEKISLDQRFPGLSR